MSDAAQGPAVRGRGKVPAWLARPLDVRLSPKAVELTTMFVVAMCAAYMVMALKVMLEGGQAYHFGDFFALWTSAVVTHGGDAAINFNPDALHQRQVALGMNPEGMNPFPYPPTLLLVLGPLGALTLPVAFAAFMIPSFAAYLWAMTAGRWREWWWPLAAVVAPATGNTLVSGQSGYLSGALMVGALRLLPTRPALAGVLFGLLAYKPQLGVLVPVALVAMGAWSALATAAATVGVCVLASGAVYGFSLWGLWAHSLAEYATRFHPVVGYMPTIYANAIMFGAPRWLAWGLQLAVSLPVGWLVFRAFRAGCTPRAAALLLVGTYLATPHAFNYDMPMMTAALVWYFVERYHSREPLDVGEMIALFLAFAMPFIMLNLKTVGMPMSFAPLGLMFALIAWPRRPLCAAAAQPA